MVLKYNLSPVQGRWVMPKSRPHTTTSVLTPVNWFTSYNHGEKGIWTLSPEAWLERTEPQPGAIALAMVDDMTVITAGS